MASSGGLSASAVKPDFNQRSSPVQVVIFLGLLGIGLGYMAWALVTDVTGSPGGNSITMVAFLLLAVALLIALGFEFVNGFHDTANAVATVIYTHSVPPNVAVVWSGLFNFLGVLTSSGAVAYGIISLLPVELILQVTSGAGFAMVFALLIAAIIWNLGTWWLGLPASSSHTMVGSVIGVGVANAIMRGRDAMSGVDGHQVWGVFKALLVSPVVGFFCAALLLLAMKALVKNRKLYEEPTDSAPPLWIRILLIFTCTGVSFAHGSNDGQKGMGLIMLILVGVVPMAYGLNHAVTEKHTPQFVAVAYATQANLAKVSTLPAPGTDALARSTVSEFIRTKEARPEVIPALAELAGSIGKQVQEYGSLAKVPSTAVGNVRNDMFLASEAISVLTKSDAISLDEASKMQLKTFQAELNTSTKFIPVWVKVVVAIALGLGTMVGWKRIVKTVGEKIGKTHLTYGQGAAAELVAMTTIGAADAFGLPVSTTHVLSSGIAGVMTANGSGLQASTLRNIALAWLLTLPCAMMLSGSLYWLFSHLLS
ncbi:inorganic phosphate transporter [Comamonas odontotermitis]|uniref:inorganic phosphate transporter n=1 Tax=Comamonas odontotermitis TaxID=379895 RepID=UPI0037BF6B6E